MFIVVCVVDFLILGCVCLYSCIWKDDSDDAKMLEMTGKSCGGGVTSPGSATNIGATPSARPPRVVASMSVGLRMASAKLVQRHSASASPHSEI